MTVNKNWNESDLICAALGERTVRAGAEWLNEKLPDVYQISHATVYNWTVLTHQPNEDFLRALTTYYAKDDERHQLGAQIKDMRQQKMVKKNRIYWVGKQG